MKGVLCPAEIAMLAKIFAGGINKPVIVNHRLMGL
jgi:hypothetical protein